MKLRTATLLLFAIACAPSPAPQDANGTDQPPPAAAPSTATLAASAPAAAPDAGAAQGDTGSVARLEREARALAHAEGCGAGACRIAPVGIRACGGPRTYIAYCAATTDSAALFAKLAELARAEEALNRTSGTMSTCEYRMPPTATLQGGHCVAVESQGESVQ